MSEPLKMYIFINSDLNMTTGKIASQVGHIVHMIIEELVRNGYEQYPISEEYLAFAKWNKNCIKIVLKATQQELLELLKLDSKNDLRVRAWYDNGQTTQVLTGSLTGIGFFPSSTMDQLISGYKLL
jgi:peptidyl-tRNA hydrolase